MFTNFAKSPSVSLAKALSNKRVHALRLASVRKHHGFKSNLPSNHIGALVDVGDAVHEALDTSEALTHDGLGIVAIVEILCHILYN